MPTDINMSELQTAADINDNSITPAKLNVAGNGTNGQLLQSDGDGSMTWVAPPSGGSTVTVGQVSTNFSTDDSNKYYTLNMQSSGLNFVPHAAANMSVSYGGTHSLGIVGTAPVTAQNHCNNTTTPSTTYQSRYIYHQSFTNGSFNCTRAQVKYSYLVIS